MSPGRTCRWNEITAESTPRSLSDSPPVLHSPRPDPRAAMRIRGHEGSTTQYRSRMPASAVGSRRISCVTRTPSKCHAKESPLLVIQRQLGHADLGITSAYLPGIDNTEIIHAVHERPPGSPHNPDLTRVAGAVRPPYKAIVRRGGSATSRTQLLVAKAVARSQSTQM